MEALHKFMDRDKNGVVTIRELLVATAPDINNDGTVGPDEFEKAKITVRILLAQMIDYDERHPSSPILTDDAISLKELRAFSRDTIIDLFTDQYNADGELIQQPGRPSQLLTRADVMLQGVHL